MDVILVTGEKVSKKSRLPFCLKPFATSLVLNFSTVPSGWSFFFRTHLQPMVVQPDGNSSNFQVLLEISESISSYKASFQNTESVDVKASCKVIGFSSAL